MIAIFRIFIMMFCLPLIFIFGCAYCLLNPRNPNHVFNFGRCFSKMSKIFGIKIDLRMPKNAYSRGQCIYIANHQNNWDMVTVSSAVTPKVVTVGKKSLVWIPLFGQLYWLAGNILIDRFNHSKARCIINQIVKRIKYSDISVWIFPEGTRSRGRGLLPFKMGAFHAAVLAGVPIIPIVCTSTTGIRLNRWNNGYVIVEILSPVSTEKYNSHNVRELAKICHLKMKDKLFILNREAELLNR
ncbi:1-acylglycerol-3-phosphate O-acyltransferase [Candidatus Photodesmus anomalopis]|uniref:1-acyl-sn-glycerol-3-phosphate acyltransferase n=1 Tax=Candidatus Photodesmus katoptron Akat1 TaxID=1236703 RepID=S3EGG0_9GAMM|nr:1-acylglycerol-3-phosphate O-acyltransferase [Candidatus Photodesmus katoptron]EPE37253.1 1-acyl-sn-glycerol-3-phosphate acyltransferase [Candidatus Photodesmus katoptron Akat1]